MKQINKRIKRIHIESKSIVRELNKSGYSYIEISVIAEIMINLCKDKYIGETLRIKESTMQKRPKEICRRQKKSNNKRIN